MIFVLNISSKVIGILAMAILSNPNKSKYVHWTLLKIKPKKNYRRSFQNTFFSSFMIEMTIAMKTFYSHYIFYFHFYIIN